MLRLLPNEDVNRIEQTLQIALLNKRRAEVRHDEIPDEHYPQVWQFDEHGIGCFSAFYRNECNTRSPDLHLGSLVNGYLGLKTAYIIHAEAFAKEVPAEIAGRIEFFRQLFVIIASGIEARLGIKGAEIGVSTNMVP